MHRPRHAKPSRARQRLPAVLLGAAVLAVPGSRGSAVPVALPATEPVSAPALAFDAEPAFAPLATPAPHGAALPGAAVLLLPATPGRDLVASPGPVPAAARLAYVDASELVAASGCTVPWRLLSAIGAITSDHGRHVSHLLLDGRLGWVMTDSDHGRYDGSTRYDGPVGPLQLLPASFRKAEGSRTADPRSLRDSAVAAARYLCAVTTGLRTQAAAARALTTYGGPAFAAAVEKRAFSH